MFLDNLYNLTNDSVEVYDIEDKEDEIRKFGKLELQKINKDERVLLEEPTRGWLTPTKGVIYSCGSFILRKTIYSYEKELIDAFLNKEFDDVRIASRYSDELDKVIFCYEPFYPTYNKQIQLTKDLYMQLKLSDRDYRDDYLQTEDLSTIKDLFTISSEPIAVISLDNLYKMYRYANKDIFNNTFEEEIEYLDDSTNVYKKLIK